MNWILPFYDEVKHFLSLYNEEQPNRAFDLPVNYRRVAIQRIINASHYRNIQLWTESHPFGQNLCSNDTEQWKTVERARNKVEISNN